MDEDLAGVLVEDLEGGHMDPMAMVAMVPTLPGDGVAEEIHFPTTAFSLGFHDGGQHLMQDSMLQHIHIMVTDFQTMLQAILMHIQVLRLQNIHGFNNLPECLTLAMSRKEVIMPFGMGRAGWFMWPYMVQWLPYQYSWYGDYGPYYGYPSPYAYVPMTKDQEISMLEEQKRMLEEELTQITSRIAELQKSQ